MQFIIVNKKAGRFKAFNANGLLLSLIFSGLVGVPAAIGYFSYLHGAGEAAHSVELFAHWRQVLQGQSLKIEIASRNARDNLNAAVLRVAKLQARIVRLDALGGRLTKVAELDKGEFDFSRPPALGGPLSTDMGVDIAPSDYLQQLHQLAADIENREQQLDILEVLLINQKIHKETFLAGWPVLKGWMSSRYGYRIDPINGKKAWHNGVDFASTDGENVVTVAAGMVVYSGTRLDYGKMIEINHGGGFSTRYGHHKKLIAKVGDIVKKGHVIGLMGSSGRATGPHVHFEVFKHGKSVDPAIYIQRASR